jgi:hypothetical protein
MDATLHREDGIATTKSAKSNVKPSVRPLNSQVAETNEAATEDDGLEFLNHLQVPPDLTGHDGSTFTVAKDINLMSPILIDILTDKVPNSNSTTIGFMVQPTVALAAVPQAVVAPKASDWDEW